MMTDLPAPLTPAECDCTDLDGFMLNVERLMASELVALSSHEIIGAALLLWCRAWKQTPAASLPDDDKVNAAFARLALPRFRKLKPEVMRGFVKCSDGRLYHRTLAAEAARAFEKKQAFRKKRESDAERLRKWRKGGEGSGAETPAETPQETQSETRFVAEGQGRDRDRDRDRDDTGQGDKPSPPEPRPRPPSLVVVDAVNSPWLDPSKSLALATGGAFVAGWISAGADLDLDIIPTVKALCLNRSEPVGSWKYFDRAVRKAAADRKAAEAPQPPITATEQTHERPGDGSRPAHANGAHRAPRGILGAAMRAEAQRQADQRLEPGALEAGAEGDEIPAEFRLSAPGTH